MAVQCPSSALQVGTKGNSVSELATCAGSKVNSGKHSAIKSLPILKKRTILKILFHFCIEMVAGPR